ncbi:uncharacterized protein [Musca autumnalis]|uniref:uncharacterized protein n=1 Tax=Musca autumnalis TaxID=221902 RepID=UPI003CF2770B
MGQNGLGNIRNENGDRLDDFCARHSLFIGGTSFIHKDIHKYTWHSPDGRTRNQIDHIITSKLIVGSLIDGKAKRGADIDSDHQLLVGTFRLRPAAIKRKKATSKYNIVRLQNQARPEAYNSAMRLNIGDVNSVATSWDSIAQSCKQSAQTILGQGVERRKPWIRESTWSEITNLKILKNRMEVARTPTEKAAVNAEYRRSAANFKYLTRIDRKIYYNNIADEAEHASNVGSMRQVYVDITLRAQQQSKTKMELSLLHQPSS